MAKSILQIAPTPFFADRGCHIRVEGIVRCLTELGYRNTVCTYHHGRDIAGIETVRIDPIKGYTSTAAGPSKYKLLADWKLLWLCVRQYRRQKPQIIHAHLHEGLLIGLLVKLMFFWRRTPVIGDMQGSLTGELEAHGSFAKLPFMRGLTHLLEWLLLRSADYIVCSSARCLTKLQSEFNLSSDRILLAQDGAVPVLAMDTTAQDQLKSALDLPLDKILAVYSGGLLDSKGLSELKSLIKLCASLQNLHFLIIGYPVGNLEPFLRDNSLEVHCTLTGQVEFERLSIYLSIADLAIDPKRSNAGEGSGKILNYLACGLPVAAFDHGNNRDFLPAGNTLANTVEELVDLVRKLQQDVALRDLLGKANRAHFSQNYSWQITRAQLSKAYQLALNDGN
jgi:glycosyltransferase involved in cell wall biosynthesis